MLKILFISVLPVILLLFYIYKKDVDKEPRGLLTLVFGIGCISTIPIAIVEIALGSFFPTEGVSSFLGVFVTVFMTIAIIEEFGKWLITYLICYRNKDYNHPYDGIVYAVFASLGFAAVENILYVVSSGFGTGILRALLSVPSHVVDAVYMGYFLSMSKKYLVQNDNNKSFVYLLLSIMIPGVTHALYDSLIFYVSSTQSDLFIIMLLLIFFAFVILTYIVAIILVNKLSKEQLNFDKTPVVKTPKKFCPNCGAPLNNGACDKCGFKDN